MFYCTTTWVYWFGSEERRLTPLSLIISYFWWWDNNDLFLGELSLLRRVLHNIQVVVMRFWDQKLGRRRRSDKDYVEMQFLQLARHSTKIQRKEGFFLASYGPPRNFLYQAELRREGDLMNRSEDRSVTPGLSELIHSAKGSLGSSLLEFVTYRVIKNV